MRLLDASNHQKHGAARELALEIDPHTPWLSLLAHQPKPLGFQLLEHGPLGKSWHVACFEAPGEVVPFQVHAAEL